MPVNAVSRSQYDAVENQYKAAQSNLKQAQSNYDVSRNQTGYNQLIANKNGVITERNIEIGQVIAAGQPAFQLAIAGERDVVIGVPEQAVTEIKTGQDAWVTLWSKPQEKFAGYVREISPAADQSRTYSVKVALREGNSAIQLGQSARVFLTAPLGIIGVVLFLLLFNKPFGFVAMLGTIALSGMIMRNSLILIDQIEQDIQSGESAWDAIINATVRRCRPIVLTALAAVLAMIPLSRSIFFGPMAVAIMGGLIVATLLTLFFLPALYAQWFKVKKTQQNP
nr:efflux RND transporter permease subunit [Acinetobacter sp. YH12070]